MPGRIAYHRPLPPNVVIARPVESKEERIAAKRFYASTRWRKFRRYFLSKNPLCSDCKERTKLTAAEHVHHKIKRTARPDLCFDETNCLSLCEACHSTRTVKGE